MRKLIGLIFILLIIGCKQDVSKQQALEEINQDSLILDDPDDVEEHKIILRGMSGNYPETIKEKQLGEGLLTNYYEEIKNFIIKNFIGDRAIKIAFKGDDKNENIVKIKRELKYYFAKLNDEFSIVFDGPPDVIVYITDEDGIIVFKTKLKNLEIFNPTPPKIITLPKTIQEIQEEANSEWSEVKISTNTGGYLKYKVMKSPVQITEYYPNKVFKYDRAVTNISFDKADEWCQKHKGGSVVSLYVFEMALRKGLLLPATKFKATKEWVAAFDNSDNSDDMKLIQRGDVVSIQEDPCENIADIDARLECYSENTDYSNMLVFNYSTKEYEQLKDIDSSINITFRCMKKD